MVVSTVPYQLPTDTRDIPPKAPLIVDATEDVAA